ncbi:hypothetical protein [Rubrivirga sp.]|uniref:hypothetical protein n=1 Tax=Rubrivirga sp. TaxID=1885344 RepID=UPI003B524424
MSRLPLLLALLALVAGAPSAQVGFGLFNGRNHPELDWQVATTEHFEIIYPSRLAGIEAEAAAVAEATFDALTVTFSPDSTALAFPEPIRIYLSDEDEIANGIAYNVGPSGFTTIWVHVNETAEIWTGDVKWLRKVIAHEVAHLVHYRAIRSNLGLLDIFFGDPLPSFWTEGLAQYATERWDAQRGDRWLRTATFEDRLSYADGTSPQNGRLRYAVGNSQVRYLAQSRGDSTLAKILAHRTPVLLGLGRIHDFGTAFRAVTGESYATFNEEWRKHVNVYYNTQAGQMERLDSLDARPFGLPGQVVYDVAFSPDTARVAAVVLPSLNRPVRRLITIKNPGADSTSGDLRILAEGSITGPISWSPDGEHLAFARTRRGAFGSLVNDLYLVRSAGGGLRRLTTDRRAISPTFAPDGRRLAFVGADGSTANLFELDLETGAERPLTAFTGDVQIPTARWSPDGARIAFSLFDADGTRHLATLDTATGTVTRLDTDAATPRAERDDRLPVWNAAGDSLAFTSLRDRAPNVFVGGTGDWGLGTGDVVRSPSAPNVREEMEQAVSARPLGSDSLAPSPQSRVPARSAQRVTFLYDGAAVHDWLPPDSLHPAGRLVLVSSETKRRDRVFVVDARRRPTVVADSVAVPPAYAAWTSHRPPVTIPDAIAPDPALIRERRPYNSWANVTHAITLALPYGDPGEDGALFTADDDWGVFANSLFLEPLGKHQLAVLAGVSVTRPVDKSFLLLSYVNQQLAPTLTLDLYRFPSPSSFYGSSVLVEDLTGGDLSASLALDLIDRPYTTTLVGARVRYAYASPLALDRFDDIETTGLGVPEAGTRFDVQVGAAYKFQRPYRWNGITPLDGTGLRARLTAGVPALGGDAFLRPDALGYHVQPVGLGRTRLFLKGRATAVVGETLAQDYVGLARYDDVDVQLPFVGALTLDDAERVRGYRSYAVGTRSLFGTAELRLPILVDLQTTVLGLARFGPISPSLFVDGGLVWTGSDFDNAARRVGVGVEVANLVSLGGFELRHAVGLATPASTLDELWDGERAFDDLDLYYRIQAAVPF